MSSEKRKAPDAGTVSKRLRDGGEGTPSSALTTVPSTYATGAVVRTSSLAAPIMLLTGHQSEVFSAKFSPDGQNIASASFDRLVFLWNTFGDCKNYNVLRGHKGAVLEVQWSADGRHVYSASSDKTVSVFYRYFVCLPTDATQQVAVWDAETGDRIKKFKGHTSFVHSCAVSRSGHEIAASGGDDNKVFLWDLRQKNAVQNFNDKYQVTSVTFSKDSTTVFSGGIDNEIKAWDLRKPGHISYSMVGHLDTITGLRVSPDGSMLLSNAMDNTVRVWDVKPFAPTSNRLLKVFEGAAHGLEKHLLKPCWSTDGDFIAAGSADRSVIVWDANTRRIVYKLPGHKGCVTEVDWHPKEPVILSASNDKTLFLGEVNPAEVKDLQ
ncbi:U5 small nuclear ribonucleoprotein [Entophlyctis luteolus]|nr:U5 small nuclear ribonucleoprotein [Entophlyctis luteolus]